MTPQIELLVLNASNLGELAQCLEVLKEGEAVNIEYARELLPRALRLAVHRDAGKIVALGAIKCIRTDYAADKVARSGHSFDINTPEVGYIAVLKSHRGTQLSQHILKFLLESFENRPLFATTSNGYMKGELLPNFDFQKKGKEWQNPDGDWISLWLKTSP